LFMPGIFIDALVPFWQKYGAREYL